MSINAGVRVSNDARPVVPYHTMKLIPLSSETTLKFDFTHKCVLTYADLVATAAAYATIQIYPRSTGTFVAGTIIYPALVLLKTPFTTSDVLATSLVVEIGDGNDPDRFCAQTEILDPTSHKHFTFGATHPYGYEAADGLDAKFTVASTGTPLLSQLTAGELEIYFKAAHTADISAMV